MSAGCKIGVDGGGTKTECILLDLANNVVARHQAPGSNPSIAGPEVARRTVADALITLRRQAPAPVAHTLLCMAGARAFWKEFAVGLEGFGHVTVFDDARPVLELATNGVPGLVLHSGTGSVVAARAPSTTRAGWAGVLATLVARTSWAAGCSRAGSSRCKAGLQPHASRPCSAVTPP